ncbi:MAG: adenylate/guanylate cyclase domain-containing protein [Gaiellaceae bacterium]
MPVCASCGRESAEDARFCSSCGTALGAPEPAREQRKVVTVLFCDLVGSTALGESTDPEALRARMRRYFEDLRAILERHGGTVEKFVGDAVMAVFGIPVSHEDDALRAVRAAEEMRGAIAAHGLEARIGVNTGEVVVGGESETLVTGDAVNVAARLEQAAGSGEILIGDETRQLVRDAVRVEPVEALELKGKSEPVDAFRLLDIVGAEGLLRQLETPLVGRERERQRLWRDYEDAVADHACQLFTLLGPAGIGKSRLVADFLERIGDSADVLRGHCLSYGDGITYWPLVEMLIAIGVDPDDVIGTSPPETQLAFRRLLEERARDRPQVVVIDDLQWAEPVFVDLVEHVADLSRGVPIFLLCVARTELLDSRPGWGGGKLNATAVLLEPLGEVECGVLIESLAGDAQIDEETSERIRAASEGNPLFVEEMLAMVREQEGDGDGEIVVPPTIHALLQARLDSLDGDVRVVLERGSVEGQLFHKGSVAELAPEPVRGAVESHLSTLVRKELIRPDTPTFTGDDAFRFRHLLIRDAAYESLPKATRAELHERFADWLATHDLVERDEIVGYHLEQSHRYRAELDPGNPTLDALASRTAAHLATAGRSALDRSDLGAASSLLQRAAGLLSADDEARAALVPDLCESLWETHDVPTISALLASAQRSGDAVVRAKAAILESSPDLALGTATERRAKRDLARTALEEVGNDEGLSLYWRIVGRDAWYRLQADETIAALENALAHAERAGSTRRAQEAVGWISASYAFGPTPVREAIDRVEDLRTRSAGMVLIEAYASTWLGLLLAMQGDTDRARSLVRSSVETFHDAGLPVTAAGMSMGTAWVELSGGEIDASREALGSALRILDPLDERGYRPTVILQLAELEYHQGRSERAAELCARGRALTTPEDLINFVYLDMIEGGIAAEDGRLDDGEARVRHAVALSEKTDFYWCRAASLVRLAEVLALSGRTVEASETAAAGLAVYRSKGDLAGTALARERLAPLGIEIP